MSPPIGGPSISYAIEPSDGCSIQVTSACQPFSRPWPVSSLMPRIGRINLGGNLHLAAQYGLFCVKRIAGEQATIVACPLIQSG